MAVMRPDFDVATYLAGLSHGTLTVDLGLMNPSGTGNNNMVVGRMPAEEASTAAGKGIPAQVVAVIALDGRPPQPYMGGTAGSIYYPTVLIMVRGTSKAFDSTQALARSIRAAMHRAAISGYWYCLAKESEPLYIGTDRAGNHEFAMNFDVRYTSTP